MRALLRPWCWMFGHRLRTVLTFRGPVLWCRRCGVILGSPQRSPTTF